MASRTGAAIRVPTPSCLAPGSAACAWPDAYRAASFCNLDPWYAAFGVTPAQKTYLPPQERVCVW